LYLHPFFQGLLIVNFQQQWDAQYTDKWDAINLTLVPFSAEEELERDELLSEVTDPNYMFNRGQMDADAEGEVDDTIPSSAGGGIFDNDVEVNGVKEENKIDVTE